MIRLIYSNKLEKTRRSHVVAYIHIYSKKDGAMKAICSPNYLNRILMYKNDKHLITRAFNVVDQIIQKSRNQILFYAVSIIL